MLNNSCYCRAKLVKICQKYERKTSKIIILIFFGEERLAISKKMINFAKFKC